MVILLPHYIDALLHVTFLGTDSTAVVVLQDMIDLQNKARDELYIIILLSYTYKLLAFQYNKKPRLEKS